MSREWRQLDFQRDWGGLIDRRQVLDYGPAMASLNRNVEYFGGTPAKRLGSQYVNGWGTIAQQGWTTTAGTVTDVTGITTSDLLDFYYPDGTSELAHAITSIVSGVITLTSALVVAPPAGTAIIARRPLNSGARIDGLFQANFRDGTRKLLAAAGNTLYTLPALGAGLGGTAIGTDYPATTVDANWAGNTTGTLTSVEGLVVGDKIVVFNGAGPTTRLASGTYVTVTSVTPSTRTIVVSPALGSNPQSADVVQFYPLRTAADTHFVQYANMTHIVTDTDPAGETPPIKYRNTSGATYELQKHGIAAPTHSGTAPAAADGGAGNLSANALYSWRFKFRNADTVHESEAGPEVMHTIGGTNQEVDLTNLPVSVDPQVTHLDIYRTTANGAGIWFFVASITNGTTSHTDNVSDVLLGAQMREFLDNVIPDEIGVLALWPHANRLIGINRATGAVVFSDQIDLETGSLKPESWPVDNFLFINYDDGDKPIAVLPFFDSVLIVKERSVFRITGIPPAIMVEPVIFRQDLTAVGTFNQKAVVVDQNEALLPFADGVYQISRWEGDQGSFQSRRISRAIDAGWQDLNLAQVKKSHAVFFRERRQYRIFTPSSTATEPDRSYVYQFEGNVQGDPYGWALWTFNEGAAGLLVTASHVGRGEPDRHYIGTSTGDVLLLDTGTAERGAFAYTFEYATTHFAPAGKGKPARGRAFDMAISAITDVTMTLEVETDFAGPQATVTISFAGPEGFTLDVDVLDVDVMGAPDQDQATGTILFTLGEYHRLRFREFSATGSFRIQNWSYWYQVLTEQARARPFLQDRM